MNLNNFASSTIQTNLTINNASEVIGMNDKMTVLFNMFFDSDEDLVDINTRVFLYLKECIEASDKSGLIKFLSEPALLDVHPSIMKSTLIITEGITSVNHLRDNLQACLERKLNS